MQNRNVNIPVEPFAAFIDAASKWLAKTIDQKELRLLGTTEGLHVSVGADSHYIEALIETKEPCDLEAPVFLDMSYLTSYAFDTKELTLVKPLMEPTSDKKDKRAQFKAPGCNFRIPIRSGDIWHRNVQDLKQFEPLPRVLFSRETLKKVYEAIDLPDSFKQPTPLVALRPHKDGKLLSYAFDGYGAFMHVFSPDGVTLDPKLEKIQLRRDFFLPAVKIEADRLSLIQSNRHTVGNLVAKEAGIKALSWVQPNFLKPVEDVPADVEKTRKGVENSLVFDTKELKTKAKQALIFHKGDDFQKVPLKFTALNEQTAYQLSSSLAHSEMNVDGLMKEKTPRHTSVRFQAAAFRDYLDCLDSNNPTRMEVFRGSVILYQEGTDQLLYWLPIQEFTNA